MDYVREHSPWFGYLRAYLGGRQQTASLTEHLDWLAAHRSDFEAAGSNLTHPLRGASGGNRALRDRYRQVVRHLEPHLVGFVGAYRRQIGAHVTGRGGAPGFRTARQAAGVSPTDVADTIDDTAWRLTQWAAELTETSVHYARLFGRGDPDTVLGTHQAFLTACTACRAAVRAWRFRDDTETRHRLDEAFTAMFEADAEYARIAGRWLAEVRKELLAHARRLERGSLDLLHADLQRARVAGEAVRTILGAASAVLLFTPLAAVATVTSALSGLLTGIDMAATEAAVRRSVDTDQDIIDRTGMHIERDGHRQAAQRLHIPGLIGENPEHGGRSTSVSEALETPNTVAGAVVSGTAKGDVLLHGVLPDTVRTALNEVRIASGPITHLTGSAGVVMSAANMALHAYDISHPPSIVPDADGAAKRRTAEQALEQSASLRGGSHAGGRRLPPAEQVWRNALHAARPDPWLAANDGAWLQNPLQLPLENVVFTGERDGRFGYSGALEYVLGDFRNVLSATWTLTPEGVLHIDETTRAALAEACAVRARGPHRDAGTDPLTAEEKAYTDFAANARDEDFIDNGHLEGWLDSVGVNERFTWPSDRVRDVVAERLRLILSVNDKPDTPCFLAFIRHADLMTLHTSGLTHRWLTLDGRPDDTDTHWPEGTLTALRERLTLGY